MGSVATIADRYAQAIFELGLEDGTLPALAEQVLNFAATYEADPDLRGVIENPLIPPEQRGAVLREVAARLNLGPLAKNVIGHVARRRRLLILPEIARRLSSLSDENAGIARAIVTSAGPMPESFFTKLADELGTLVGRKVLLDRREDPTLIAGVVTRIGDNTIDGSLRGRLDQLERQLLD